ncbi:MAG: asparaginase [Epsilonproteobacteria bacterium]|nr:MAG: asparaginase [Campylobacterota bacterium]
MKDILIINTGGTFNKIYNQKTGDMNINKNEADLKNILKIVFKKDIKILNIIQKDSLDFDDNDRQLLSNTIKKQKQKNIIIIHGTDTMNQSCEFVAKQIKNKNIVFTGAFVPYSIDAKEAVANLSLAIGYMQACKLHEIHIAMHGLVKPHNKIKKDRQNDTFIVK